MTRREERKSQYVRTGERVGGFLGGVVAFLAPFTSALPKWVWGTIFAALAAAMGFGARGVVEPAAASVQSDTAMVAMVQVLKALEGKVDAGNAKLTGTMDTVRIELALVRRAIVRTEAGRRAIRELEEERRAERSLQGSTETAIDPPVLAGPNWFPEGVGARR